MIQVRSWIGTLNGADREFDYSLWMERLYTSGVVKFVCGQLEEGHETGNLHLQYMVQLDRSRRLAHLRTAICNRSHWEPVYGSNTQAKAYCTKEDTRVDGPWEYGQLSVNGKRRGLDEAIEAVKMDKPLHEVTDEFSLAWVNHGKGPTSLRQQLKLDADRRSFGPEVWVLWGPSGTGKSRFANDRWPDAFWKAPESKWWDGYSGQETVVLDDFKDYGMPLVDLQRLLDWYPLWVEVKGGSVPMLARHYVITSNTSPEDWYLKADPHKTVLRRIRDFTANGERLIYCDAGWVSPGPRFRVILSPSQEPLPRVLAGRARRRGYSRRHRQLA